MITRAAAFVFTLGLLCGCSDRRDRPPQCQLAKHQHGNSDISAQPPLESNEDSGGRDAVPEHARNSQRIESTLSKLRLGDHVTLVALGDSITANTLHNRGHMNWVSLLDVALAEKYGSGVCTVINAGIPGATYADSLDRLDRDVLRFKPDMVIIMLGMNDSGKGAKKISDFRNSVISAVEKIRSACGSDIILMTPNPIVLDTGMRWVDGMPPGEVWEGERPLHEYARVIAEVAVDTNCALIDHYSRWKSTWYPADGLRDKNLAYQYSLWPRMANCTHPGPLGHRVLFRELARLFQTAEHFAWE